MAISALIKKVIYELQLLVYVVYLSHTHYVILQLVKLTGDWPQQN